MERQFFKVFRDDRGHPGTDGMRNLLASFSELKRNRRSDVLAAPALPVRRPAAEDGEWWSSFNSRGLVVRADELQRANDQLRQGEIQYKEAAAQLLIVAARLSEVARRKDEFLAILAHELRNPLAPISNALQIMRRSGGNGEATQSAAKLMDRQIGQMVRLVDDLLDVSRISIGKIELRRERVELASIIGQAVETARPAIEAARHELTVTLPPNPVYLNADPIRMAQAFGNLLNNSCKYSEPNGRISLTAELAANDVMVAVKDTGIGIAPDMLPRIFEMFVQADQSLERSRGGLGVGLTLVRRLVELHGGSVRAFSEGVGQGSEFVVCLPMAKDESISPMPQASSGGQARVGVRRILVVDDSADAASSLAVLLEMIGIETRIAHEGLAALDAAETFRPDVLLLDIGLPKLNGYEVARKIRSQPWGKPMVLVALTGWGQDEDRRKSKEAGFDHHLVKPVAYDALMSLLAGLPVASED